MNDLSTVIIIFGFFVLAVGFFILLVFVLSKIGNRKDEEKAVSALQPFLIPGAQLIEFTKVSTKGANAMTVLHTGAIGSAISGVGGVNLFIGLTNRFLHLTPVGQNENCQSLQTIPLTDILDIEFESGLYKYSVMKIITQKGVITLYVISKTLWLNRALAIKKAFLNLLNQYPVTATDVSQQPTEWKPINKTQLVPIKDSIIALSKRTDIGKYTMITGGLIAVLGGLLIIKSGGNVFLWGEVYFGVCIFIAGLIKFVKARKKDSRLPK